MAKKQSGTGKSKSGCAKILGYLILIMLAMGIISAILEGILTFLQLPVVQVILGILLIVLICLAPWWIIVNSRMKNHRMDVLQNNETMNQAADLDVYFSNRDEMITYLQQMQKGQWLTRKAYRIKPMPKQLLVELAVNESKSIHSALERMTEDYKLEVKVTGDSYYVRMSDLINKYYNRLDETNRNFAAECLQNLRAYEQVAGKIEETDGMEGHQFEYWCADLLRKNGFSDVSVTPGSGDQGVDVLATKNEIRYAIQCKCYSQNLGNTPVQEVYAGKEMYQCQVGVVMTNQYFTSGARELAEKTRVLLWDRDKLCEMLES